MSDELSNYFSERQGRLLADLRELVEHESPSLDAAATTALTTALARRLESHGAAVRLYPTASGSHLMARATFGHPSQAAPVMLLGHVDTVWPRGTLARRGFRVADGRAYGPGVFDMKSGVALMVAALEAIPDLGLQPPHPLKILLTCDEESGSTTSRQLIESEAAECAAVLVLEPSLPGGAAKTERKGFAIYEIVVHGVAAHAGLDPDKGVSATTELAHQLLALQRLEDRAAGVSVNAGVIRGGTSPNVVAAEARAEVDVRFRTLSQAAEIARRIEALTPVLDGARLEIRGGINRPPLERTAGVSALFEQARAVAADLGFDLGEGSSGGASDGNLTAALGVPTLDGLGVEGDGAHAEHEHILLADLPRRAALLTALLTRLGVCLGSAWLLSADRGLRLAGSF
jgi:glutamate carboxypeptidase